MCIVYVRAELCKAGVVYIRVVVNLHRYMGQQHQCRLHYNARCFAKA